MDFRNKRTVIQDDIACSYKVFLFTPTDPVRPPNPDPEPAVSKPPFFRYNKLDPTGALDPRGQPAEPDGPQPNESTTDGGTKAVL